MTAKIDYIANWKPLRALEEASIALLKKSNLAGCKTCVCGGNIYMMTVAMDLYRFEPEKFTWRHLNIWEGGKKPKPREDFILTSNGVKVYYVGDHLYTNSTKMQVGPIDPVKAKLLDLTSSAKASLGSSRLWAFDAHDRKSIFIPSKEWIVEINATGVVVWDAQRQKFAYADAYLVFTFESDIENLPSMSKTFYVSLSFRQKMAYLYQPDEGERPTLHAESPIEAIPDLPKTKYILKYYNWIVILGVEMESSPKEQVSKIRMWVMDFDKELRQSRLQSEYAMKWQEVNIQGDMPNIDAVRSVNIINKSLYILASNPDPVVLIIDVTVLDQARVPDYASIVSDELTRKRRVPQFQELEIAELKAERARSIEIQKQVIDRFKKELEKAKEQNETLQKTIEYEKSTAKEELHSLKEENKKLKKELDATKNTKDKNEQTVIDLKNRLTSEKEEYKKEMESLRTENDRFRGNNLDPLNMQQLKDLQNNLKLALYKIKNEINDRTETSNCLICTERPRNMVFSPCHHMCICEQCANTIQDIKCPVCRSNGEVFKVYL